MNFLRCYSIALVPAFGAVWVATFGRSDSFSIVWMAALAIAVTLYVTRQRG